jgi:hypothetical protein
MLSRRTSPETECTWFLCLLGCFSCCPTWRDSEVQQPRSLGACTHSLSWRRSDFVLTGDSKSFIVVDVSAQLDNSLADVGLASMLSAGSRVCTAGGVPSRLRTHVCKLRPNCGSIRGGHPSFRRGYLDGYSLAVSRARTLNPTQSKQRS